MEKTFELEGRTFTYRNTDRDNGDLIYDHEWVPRGRKKRKRAMLELYSDGRTRKLTLLDGWRQVNHKCISPSGHEFFVVGSFLTFFQLYVITEEQVRKSSRTRNYTPQGWQFKRFEGRL
jgi:hypothetical protein